LFGMRSKGLGAALRKRRCVGVFSGRGAPVEKLRRAKRKQPVGKAESPLHPDQTTTTPFRVLFFISF